MYESDIEELISRYPEEFFPNKAFTLIGRQESFSGVGRFDLLFKDSFGTNILMELKACGAKYDNATQLAKYKEALNARGITNILMWLVAPLVPGAIREFLDGIGIEYSEIHEATFKEVAERHAYALRDHAPALGTAKQTDTFRNPKANSSVRSHNGKFRNSLTPEFRSKLDRLKGSFPNGYRFLSYPVHNTTRIWLHSSVNVHIYCGDSFIAYVKVGGDTIEISPRFNNQISGGTHDRNEILFSKIDGLIAKHDGFKKGWVTQRYDSGAYVLRKPTPQEFFDDVLRVIEEGQVGLEKKV